MEKLCPTCNRRYVEDQLNYCLADGSFLLTANELPTSDSPHAVKRTDIPGEAPPTSRQSSVPTLVLPSGELLDTSGARPNLSTVPTMHAPAAGKKSKTIIFIVAAFAMIAVAGTTLLFQKALSSTKGSKEAGNQQRTESNANAGPATTGEDSSTAQPPMPENTEDALINAALIIKINFEDGLEDVKIAVKNRVVTLTGTVKNSDLKKRAEELATSAEGVSSVVNKITIAR